MLFYAHESYLEELTNERAPLDEQHEKWNNEMAILLNGGDLHYDLVDKELVEREQGASLKMSAPEEKPVVEEEVEPAKEEDLPPAPVLGVEEAEPTAEEDLPPAPVLGVEEAEPTVEEDLPPAPVPGVEEAEPTAEEVPAEGEDHELPPFTPLVNPVAELNEGMEAGLPPEPTPLEETPAEVVNPNDDTASLTRSDDREVEAEEVVRVTEPNPPLWKKIGLALLALANAFLAAITAHGLIQLKKTDELLNKFANQQTDENNQEESDVVDDQSQIPSDGEVEPSTPHIFLE